MNSKLTFCLLLLNISLVFSQESLDVFNSNSQNAFEYYYFLESIRKDSNNIIHTGLDSLNIESFRYLKEDINSFYDEMNDDGKRVITQHHNYIESDSSDFIRTYYHRDEAGKIIVDGQIVLKYKKRNKSPLIASQRSPRKIYSFNIYTDTIVYDISKDLQKIENKKRLDIEPKQIYLMLDSPDNRESIKSIFKKYIDFRYNRSEEGLSQIITENSEIYIRALKNLSLLSDSLSLGHLNTLEKLNVLILRIENDYDKLKSMSVDDVIKHLNNSFISQETGLSKLDSFKISRIFFYNNAAYAFLNYNGEELPLNAIFVYENGAWKLEYRNFLNQVNSIIKSSFGMQVVSDEYLTLILEYQFSKEKLKNIWIPLSER